ncbi:MAG: helix-turn-helix domain-containing protein [Ruminococcaceae bacterium]|nr:helix-turn-helix domain-containing protein [Oscillospiraceae bacterium]
MRKYASGTLNPIYIDRIVHESEVQPFVEHVHRFFEVYFLIDGHIDMFIENRTYHLKPFDLLIMPPDKLHKAILCENYKHERVVLYFDERAVHDIEILNKLSEYTGIVDMPAEEKKRVFRLMNMLLQENKTEKWHDSYVSSLLTEMLIVILRSAHTLEVQSSGLKFEKIIDYVNESYTDQISLGSVAKRFFVSEAHLSRIFKRNTGFTFTQYINYRRIIFAQKLLLYDKVTIGDIAMRSGFDNLTHFGRVFKQLTGYSPREYRKTNKSGIKKRS